MTGKKQKIILRYFYFWLTQSNFPMFICGFIKQTSATCNTLVFAGILTIITDLKKKAFLLIRLHLYA